MDNEELYDEAMKAITALFSDQSVDQAKAKENLQNLVGEIDTLIDSLE